MYALIAQKTAGLATFSNFPIADFGQLSNFWTSRSDARRPSATATCRPRSSSRREPQWSRRTCRTTATWSGSTVVHRRRWPPNPIFPKSEVAPTPLLTDLAWDGTFVYVACETTS